MKRAKRDDKSLIQFGVTITNIALPICKPTPSSEKLHRSSMQNRRPAKQSTSKFWETKIPTTYKEDIPSVCDNILKSNGIKRRRN